MIKQDNHVDAKLKHLEIIQNVVTRLAQNSFLIKGWSVLMISALFALAAKTGERSLLWVALFPLLAFWLLDGYFLWQERLFRRLYDHVRQLDEAQIDFTMNTISMEGQSKIPVPDRPSWPGAVFSKTLIIFYWAILMTVAMALALFNIVPATP